MMHRHTAVLLSAVITSAVVVPALAQTTIKAPVADTEQVLDMQLKMEEARMLPLRAMYVRYFQQAYRRYPSIPRGTLESLAYVQSRWSPLQPDAHDQNDAHLRMPPSWGVMGCTPVAASRIRLAKRQSCLAYPPMLCVPTQPSIFLLPPHCWMRRSARTIPTSVLPAHPSPMRYALP